MEDVNATRSEKNYVQDQVYSVSVRAGKRTYYFDVKTSKNNDYYLTITESKKKNTRDGKFIFEKHKLFLYKEDIDKFIDGLIDTVKYIKENGPEIVVRENYQKESSEHYNSNLSFDDLEKENEDGDK